MKTSRPLSRQIVVVADPAFGETPGDPSPIRFARLAGTSIETRRLSELFPAATIRSRNDATEQALKVLRAPRILHIATHGFFKDPASAGASHGTIDNPLLRSGLALQGANMHRAGNDDGILTALEAAYLNLWGTQLVTLSACDTGIGAVRDGEGVYGLRRAFFLAGTESLVMSMWPVSDLITRDLMAGYYDGLKKGLGRGDALRQVQLKMMKRPGRSHPYYWASFIQAGEWANLDGRR
jgi:CHAT domain-containing protein